MAEVTSIYPTRLVDDLLNSGLQPADLKAKPLGPAEKQATGAPMGADGYVLPYFDINGSPIQFYRVKLFDSIPKYRQIADAPNHVYFPPRLRDLLPRAKYLIITEGEKKAAAAVAHGFPCVALGGVDSWRNRTIHLPKNTAISQRQNGSISARLNAGDKIVEAPDTLATGLQSIIDLSVKKNIPIFICFDNDTDTGLKTEVARACALLGFELRFRGVPLRNIRHLLLDTKGSGKMGLDDYLLSDDYGPKALGEAIVRNLAQKSAFPIHPNTKEYVNKKLMRPSLPRHEQMGLAMAILSDLDAKGSRLRAPDSGTLYYFSHQSKALIPIKFSNKPDFSATPFGVKLYQDYSVSWTDQRLLGWIMTQFSGEEPITNVYPEKVLAWRGDALYYHLNDGQMVKVTADSIQILDNGDEGVLFEAGLIDGIAAKDFQEGLKVEQSRSLGNQWLEVLKDTRIKDVEGDRHRKLLSYLYYISPWFYKWRNTQLPVEITTGEAGSGKSTLYELRLSLLTGVPTLRNSPKDLRDWNASLASTGALHVTDNVQMADASLRQRLSDEICRLVTESNPSIEQRKLYEDTTLIKIPVRCVFAITAIKQPFTQIDIIQRSVITELDKGTSDDLSYDGDWKTDKIEQFGGRARWVAHQLLMVQRVLQVAKENWIQRYQARYRLINVEQLLMITAKALGEQDPTWIPGYLEGLRDERMADADWTLEGLKAFVEEFKMKWPTKWHKYRFPLNHITEWAETSEEFEDCKLLQSVRTLSRYMGSNKHTVSTTAGIVPAGTVQGIQQFRFRREDEHGDVPEIPEGSNAVNT